MLDFLVAVWFCFWVGLGLHDLATRSIHRGKEFGFVIFILVLGAMPWACLLAYRFTQEG